MAPDDTGLQMKYFVLKPEGDSKYASASRYAMKKYADIIEETNPTLAAELRSWASKENEASFNRNLAGLGRLTK